MEQTIIVYSSPQCPQCDNLKNKLKQKNINFNEINVREDDVALNKLKTNGFTGLPVVEQDGELMSGFVFMRTLTEGSL